MNKQNIHYLHFIDEPVEVVFITPPLYQKEPPCPHEFIWQGQHFHISGLLSAWRNFERRGRMERNMKPKNFARARLKGSWGVGRFHFQVQTKEGRSFEFYYDRAPKKAAHRKGYWFLLAELY